MTGATESSHAQVQPMRQGVNSVDTTTTGAEESCPVYVMTDDYGAKRGTE